MKKNPHIHQIFQHMKFKFGNENEYRLQKLFLLCLKIIKTYKFQNKVLVLLYLFTRSLSLRKTIYKQQQN